MTPILKNKQKRDTVLFWGMLALTLAFLLYVFLPGTRSPSARSTAAGAVSHAVSPAESAADNSYEERLQAILRQWFRARLADSELPSTALSAALSRHLEQVDELGRTQSGQEALRRWLNHSRTLGVFELGDPRILGVPEFVSVETAFDLYLALFMLKVGHPAGAAQLRDASNERLLTILSAPIFHGVNREIHSDPAAFPALEVFRVWLQRTDPYADSHPGLEMARHLDLFRDFSPGRWISRLRQWVDFSSRIRTFSLKWVEDDGILGRDRGVYADLRHPVYRFLGEEYAIIPDPAAGRPPKWLRELAASDAGDIELVSLRMVSTEAERPFLTPRCAWYNPLGDRCVLVFPQVGTKMDEHKDPLQKWILERRQAVRQSYHCLVFADDTAQSGTGERETGWLRFGRFLQRLGKRQP